MCRENCVLWAHHLYPQIGYDADTVWNTDQNKEREDRYSMTIIEIIVITLGVFGFVLGFIMPVDVGIAIIVCSLAAFFSGIGFHIVNSKFKKLEK